MQTVPYGPVHINVPFREPFYPKADEKPFFNHKARVFSEVSSQKTMPKETWNELLDIWDASGKKLIVAGQQAMHPELVKSLKLIQQDYKVVVTGDVISNLHTLPQLIQHHDILLSNKDEALLESLRPDLLITYGKSLISKNLKLYLRKYNARHHWHIQEAGLVADTLQSVSQVIRVDPAYFFRTLFSDLDFMNLLGGDDDTEGEPYFQLWQNQNNLARKSLYHFIQLQNKEKFSDFQAVDAILEHLPYDLNLHLANSMSVRYVNYFGLNNIHNDTEVFANRGTSGIDGSNSTAVGAAIADPKKLTCLITGDLAFFYDRNGLWNNYLTNNLRIIILNNHSGNIFRMIDGPNQQAELEEYFETFHSLHAENTARDFNLNYFFANDLPTLHHVLPAFFSKEGKSKILEIQTDKHLNAEVFNEFKKTL